MTRMEEDNLPQPLPHRLVEVMLVVGFDEDTGLPKPPGKEPEIDYSLDNIFKNDYEPCVLAAVSSSTMVYFHPFIRKDETYPPSNTHATHSSSQMTSLPELSVSRQIHRFSKHPTRLLSSSRNPKIMSHHMSTKGQVIAVPELPVSDEVIRSVAAFCFPDGAKVYKERPENCVHFLVLTDMSGSETYTSCLTFYRPYIVEKDEQGNLYFSLETSPAALEFGQTKCYTPNCILLISKYPYYTVLKACLSSLTALIEKDQKDMYTFIKEYAHILTWTPVPPAGDVAISFRNFILPFSWRFTYVPVLPSKSLGFLQAPGTFMFGCHSRHKEEAEQVEGLVLVDIDTGMVKINPDENGKVKNIPMMPLEPANVFKSKCKQIVLQFTLMDLNRDIIFDTRVEHRRFKRDSFLDRKNESDREFYERVSSSDMFKVFLQDRFNEKSDYWSDLEMRTRKEAGVEQNPKANLVIGGRSHLKKYWRLS
ncbi:hypothetical protein CHS0354_027006 [Potamilus streckersoni]|uniref:UDENN domain-containing protein n=1 Tax=Potamilus streckersoni TaxID=2493646 RepID=A0AAE0W122_9BIVA|nr:hypothetical protein CHS0354_027006 [Potamilus streckersoni]